MLDGAKGTEITNRGYTSYPLDEASVNASEIVSDVHRSYVESGSDMVTTNTFRVTSYATQSEMSTIVRADYTLLKSVGAPAIALSIGPSDGDYSKFSRCQRNELKQRYGWQAELANDCQVDMILLETVCHLEEAVMAVRVIQSITEIPVAVTCTLTGENTLISGEPLEMFVKEIQKLGVCVIGLNCVPINDRLLSNVCLLMDNTSLPLIIQPNLGCPKQTKTGSVYPVDESEFIEVMGTILKNEQVRIIGGCCGTTPHLIKSLKQQVSQIEKGIIK